MSETKSFHNYERQYALLLNRIFPDQYPCEVKATHGYARKPFQISEANRKHLTRYRINLENEGGKKQYSLNGFANPPHFATYFVD
jgi:hypothetical protein